ncbi:unnamed protein product [Protopolystoma xenopodis]|uniref:Uncharacterized protein n=1 Tax=Protopolystoma xenopodis TaxID=117903 RepID=A0A448X9V0_9PLAT|nr:unnamed protein product [Protopolystoma xenopodis]
MVSAKEEECRRLREAANSTEVSHSFFRFYNQHSS